MIYVAHGLHSNKRTNYNMFHNLCTSSHNCGNKHLISIKQIFDNHLICCSNIFATCQSYYHNNDCIYWHLALQSHLFVFHIHIIVFYGC